MRKKKPTNPNLKDYAVRIRFRRADWNALKRIAYAQDLTPAHLVRQGVKLRLAQEAARANGAA